MTSSPAPTGLPLPTPDVSAASGEPTDATAGVSPSPSASQALYGSLDPGLAPLEVTHRTAIVQLFEWRWTDIASECEQWLGPRGFAAVQISPPQEHAIVDDATNHVPWWQRYQPVSYRLESRSGTRTEFADMVKRCRAVGVDIYADVVLNHMTAIDTGTGSAGTVFTKYDYPGLYEPADFHATANPAFPKVFCDHDVRVQEPAEIQTCQLDGLADLRTESPKVRAAEIAYLADLYALGVRGFRIDAAKHIPAADLAAILGGLRAKLPPNATVFVDQEVVDLGGDAVPKAGYYATGLVDDFLWNQAVTAAFLRADHAVGELEGLERVPEIGPSDRSVTFIDSHDIQRGRITTGLVLTYKRQDRYILANVFLLASPFGRPRLMSGYAFTDTEVGPPSDVAGHTTPVFTGTTPDCGLNDGQWVCEHRWHAIAGMVGFRDVTAEAPTTANWWTNPADANQIAFGRGSAGFVAINRSTKPLQARLQTGLAAGAYCDVVAGDLRADRSSCTGATITVAADGTAAFDVPPMTAQAIHVQGRVGP